MNETLKTEIFDTLMRFTELLEHSPQIQALSHLVQINTAVVGGAVRDLMLNKPVKDIDISVQFDFYHNLKINYPNRSGYRGRHYDDYDDELSNQEAEADALEARSKEILNLLGTAEFSQLHERLLNSEKVHASQALVWLIQDILQEAGSYTINTVYDQSTLNNKENEAPGNMPINTSSIRDAAYIAMGLHAVVGVQDKNTDYPIEFLFTTDSPNQFIQLFDFNLCKIYMLKQNNEATIIPTSLFLADKDNHTMTYEPEGGVTQEKVHKSLLTRYERLYKKFPDYPLLANTKNIADSDLKFFIEQTVKTVSIYNRISSVMPEKNATKRAKI